MSAVGSPRRVFTKPRNAWHAIARVRASVVAAILACLVAPIVSTGAAFADGAPAFQILGNGNPFATEFSADASTVLASTSSNGIVLRTTATGAERSVSLPTGYGLN